MVKTIQGFQSLHRTIDPFSPPFTITWLDVVGVSKKTVLFVTGVDGLLPWAGEERIASLRRRLSLGSSLTRLKQIFVQADYKTAVSCSSNAAHKRTNFGTTGVVGTGSSRSEFSHIWREMQVKK